MSDRKRHKRIKNSIPGGRSDNSKASYPDDYSGENDSADDDNTLLARSRSLNGRTSSWRNRVKDFEGTNDSKNFDENKKFRNRLFHRPAKNNSG